MTNIFNSSFKFNIFSKVRVKGLLTVIAFYFAASLSTAANVIEKVSKYSKQKDTINFILLVNGQKKSGVKLEVYEFFNDVWFNTLQSKYEIDMQFFKEPEVRLEVANLLAQAHVNGKFETDLNLLHEYVLSLLGEKESIIRLKAVVTIGIFHNVSDIPLLIDILEEEDPVTFKASVQGLLYMCHPEAETVLRNSVEKLTKLANQQYVKLEIKQARNFKIKTKICSES